MSPTMYGRLTNIATTNDNIVNNKLIPLNLGNFSPRSLLRSIFGDNTSYISKARAAAHKEKCKHRKIIFIIIRK